MTDADEQNFYFATHAAAAAARAAARRDARGRVHRRRWNFRAFGRAAPRRARLHAWRCSKRSTWDSAARGAAAASRSSATPAARKNSRKLVGAADARFMWDIALEGMKLQRELIAKHAIACDYVRRPHASWASRRATTRSCAPRSRSLHDNVRLPQRAARRPRRAAHASCPASVTPAAATIRTAATCIPTSTRSGWPPPRRAPACRSSRTRGSRSSTSRTSANADNAGRTPTSAAPCAPATC